jgi:hypothetical protein
MHFPNWLSYLLKRGESDVGKKVAARVRYPKALEVKAIRAKLFLGN